MSYSRRQFLQLGAAGLAAGLLKPALPAIAASGKLQTLGRCLMVYVTVYEQPSVIAKHVGRHDRDAIIPIYSQVPTIDDYAPNPKWYATDGGFVHSSNVQLVEDRLNPGILNIDPTGMLFELTVPIATTRWQPNANADVAYTLYYGSTYWAVAAHKADSGGIWYELWDDRTNETYYAPAHTMRRIPPHELTPISPTVTNKRIEINTTAQTIAAYEGDDLKLKTLMSSGRRYSDSEGNLLGDFRTPYGSSQVHRKRPARHMAGDDAAAPDHFDLPGVPWVTYFNGVMAIHGTFWHNDYGTPWSHGCINVTPQIAKWFYRWALPVVPYGEALVEEIGTTVDVV